MKNKIIASILVAVFILSLASCSKETPQASGKDALHISSNEKTLFGAAARLCDVVDAVCNKAGILLNAHNNEIKIAHPDDYFLNENYILSGFSPFDTDTLDIMLLFETTGTNEQAQDVFKPYAGSMNIFYEPSKDEYKLTFSSENSVLTYSAQYNKKNDSFIYSLTEFDGTKEKIVSFIEFVPYFDNAYFLQSESSRLYVKFEEDGSIIKFFCSTLKEGNKNSIKKALYPHSTVASAYNFVVSEKQSKYETLVSFEDEIMEYTDNSSVSSKTIVMEASKYASAFYNS